MLLASVRLEGHDNIVLLEVLIEKDIHLHYVMNYFSIVYPYQILLIHISYVYPLYNGVS